MRKIIVVVSYVLFVFFVIGCGNTEPIKQKVLRVGVSPNFHPFVYHQHNSGILTGFDVDLIRDLRKELGYDKIEFIKMNFPNLIEGLEENKYDVVMSGLAITPEREQQVSFTVPYIDEGLMIAAPVDTKSNNTAMLLNDKHIAVKNCRTSFDWVIYKSKLRPVYIVKDKIAIAVAKDNSVLLEKINKALKSYMKSSRNNRLHRMYFPEFNSVELP